MIKIKKDKIFLLILSGSFLNVYIANSNWIKSIDIDGGSANKEEPVCYIDYGNTVVYYSKIESALDDAYKYYSNCTVYVIPGTKTTISEQCTIGENVTLSLPYEGTSIDGESDINTNNSFSILKPDSLGKSSVTICKCTDYAGNIIPTLIIESGGKLEVGGQRRSTSPQGCTSGFYSEIILQSEAIIDCYGEIYCSGYIREDNDYNNSKINFYDKAILTQPLVSYDWSSAGNALTAVNNNYFPFNYFDFPQVSPILNFYENSKMIGSAFFYGSTAGDMKASAYIIGGQNDNALIIPKELSSDYYISFKNTDESSEDNNLTTSKDKHKIKIDIFGKYFLNFITMNLKYFIFDIDIDSSKYFLPFSNFFDITLKSGTIFDINYKTKFLPGSKIAIEPNAIVNINSDCAFYTTYKGDNGKNISGYANINSPAELINNGILNINSNFGGKISGNENGSTNTLINTTNISDLTVTDMSNYSDETTAVFNLIPHADIKETEDSLSIIDKELLPNTTYYFKNDDTGHYFYLKGYLINFKYLDSDDGLVGLEPTFDVEVNHSNGETTLYKNPSEIRVFSGETFRILNVTNIEYFSLNENIIEDVTNRIFTVTSNSFNFEIKRKEISVDEISGISTYYRENSDEEWIPFENNASISFKQSTDLYFKVDIQPFNYSPKTTISWTKDNVLFSSQLETTAINFAQESENKTYIVKLEVIDGLNLSNEPFVRNINITVEKSCVLKGSNIRISNNKTCKIEDLSIGMKILAFDFSSGKYVKRKIVYFKRIEKSDIDVLVIEFTDGTYLETFGGQGYFDVEARQYVNISSADKYFVGKKFLGYNDGKPVIKTVKNIRVIMKKEEVYEIVTAYNYNFIANDILTVEPLIGSCNIFKITADLLYDYVEMLEDINKFGLYDYCDVKDFCTFDQFNLYNVRYLKIAVGKGLLTLNEIKNIVERFRVFSI